MQDFFGDRSTTRMLEIQCEFSDEFLTGHSTRIGLAGEQTPRDTLERLLPTIRRDIFNESDRIRDAGFENVTRLRQSDEVQDHMSGLMQFLSVPSETAEKIARIEHLFAD